MAEGREGTKRVVESAADAASRSPNAETLATPVAAVVARTPTYSASGASLLFRMQPLVEFTEIELLEKVGHGSYGVVYKAIWRNHYVAVKEFGASADQKAIETEVKQLSRVRHPNIIALYGLSVHQQSKYLIMEYAEGGSLHNFLHGKVKPPYTKSHAMSWAHQCAEGVAYLHAMKPKPLIHRDLKPLNLLLTNRGRNLKICDFGTVADKSTWMTNNKGSAAWMAPEVFEGSKYTEKCDVFSWGIVLWEVLSRQQPFKEIDNTYSIMWKIHKGERPPLLRDCPQRIQNLMTSCWSTAPDMRPSMQYVVSVMNELVIEYNGGDEPLEYEFINQQIVQSADSDDTIDSEIESNTYSISNSEETIQTANTNTTSENLTLISTSTNTLEESLKGTTTNRWGIIPEESEPDSTANSEDIPFANPFCLTPTSESSKRYNTIRNGMTEQASIALTPLTLEVDPNAWELQDEKLPYFAAAFNPFSKSDGRERLTVTDAKPIMPQAVSNHNNNNSNGDIDDCGAGDTDSDNDSGGDGGANGPDQSLHEILDPELQPEPPIANNAQSQEIYEDHCRLSKEYLRVDTKLYYAQDLKEKLLTQMDPAEREAKQELLKKMNEKEELLELYKNLKQQLENLHASQEDDSAEDLPEQQQQQSKQLQQQQQHSAGGDPVVRNDSVEDWVLLASPQTAPSQNT